MTGSVFHRRLAHEYPIVARGEGVYLYDTTGRQYLDASGGALVVNLGHGVTEIVDALALQAGRVAFAHGTQFSSEAVEAYAKALGNVSPIPNPWLYLVSGGSEAMETALKLARQACVSRGEVGRAKIIARWGSYHGATLGALSVSGRTSLRTPYAPWLLDIAHIPPAYCYRCPFGRAYPDCGTACAEALEAEILRQGPETVMAFVAEPVVGATLAAAVPPLEYWPRVREICDQYGVLLVADEVMTGFGRTGRWFAVEHWAVSPDILVTAKGASGGYYPLGLVLCSDRVQTEISHGSGSFSHGFTHANGVLGAAVGLAVLNYLTDHDLISASATMGVRLLDRLESLRSLPAVGDVRGLGLMAGVELVASKDSREPYPRSLRIAEKIQAACMARGLVVYYGTGVADGRDGDAILIGPPFIVTDSQVDRIAALLGDAVAEVTGG
jgi:adenosylmethionine-8-amino-7-oxononanoate aminotransferase